MSAEQEQEQKRLDRQSRKFSVGDGIAWAGFWIALSVYFSAEAIAKAL